MEIQLSLIIWTIICFSLLMIILNTLLFRPVLKILDERKAKLLSAREKKAENERLEEERKKQREEVILEAERRKKAKVQAALDKIQEEEKNLLKNAQSSCLECIESYREQREKELETIITAVNPEIAKVADLFVQRIVSDKEC